MKFNDKFRNAVNPHIKVFKGIKSFVNNGDSILVAKNLIGTQKIRICNTNTVSR